MSPDVLPTCVMQEAHSRVPVRVLVVQRAPIRAPRDLESKKPNRGSTHTLSSQLSKTAFN